MFDLKLSSQEFTALIMQYYKEVYSADNLNIDISVSRELRGTQRDEYYESVVQIKLCMNANINSIAVTMERNLNDKEITEIIKWMFRDKDFEYDSFSFETEDNNSFYGNLGYSDCGYSGKFNGVKVKVKPLVFKKIFEQTYY